MQFQINSVQFDFDDGFEDGVYSIERHGLASETPYIELEIRQDLIADVEGQKRWAARLAPLMTSSLFAAG